MNKDRKITVGLISLSLVGASFLITTASCKHETDSRLKDGNTKEANPTVGLIPDDVN